MDLNKMVPLKHSLKTSVKFQSISNEIVEKLKLIGDIDGNSKLSIELINFICNIIEYLVKHKYRINKENLLIFSLKRVVELTSEEEEIIKNTIKYLHDNKLILKVTKLKYLLEYSKNLIKSKF